MIQLLGLVLVSFIITSFLLVPFIDLLFFLRKKHLDSAKNVFKLEKKFKSSDTPIHDRLMKADFGTPVGGGILVILVLVLLSLVVFSLTRHKSDTELFILIFTILTFGGLGMIDDIRHIFHTTIGKYKGLSSRMILVCQLLLGLAIALLLYFQLGLNNIFLPIFGNIVLGWWYIPVAIFVIVSFANAYNISDGLDGLSTGLLAICLFAFLVLAHSVFDLTLSVFVGLWIGALIAYLYFNVFPARIYLGDAGAFGFGATLAVVGLLTGKIIGLGVIGGVYIIIVGSSLLQILAKRFFKKKLFPVAPIHMYLKYLGWEEPKIVMRFWLMGAIFAILGLWLSLFSH